MNETDFWTDDTSVLFTSFWGWTPETWGTIGWTGDRGLARRTRLLSKLTAPFIAVCYVTSNKGYIEPNLRGKIAGFYLVSHETGDRNEFTHPIHHERSVESWRHSLRALRAFSFLPEHRLHVRDFDATVLDRARSVAAMGEIVTDPLQIKKLRDTPWVEVDVYTTERSVEPLTTVDDANCGKGYVKAGPAAANGYLVSVGVAMLPRQLYVLRLDGDINAYLGRQANGRKIYKIGISASPEMRRRAFQEAMPAGAFRWIVDRATGLGSSAISFPFESAVAGEYAMKRSLASTLVSATEHLGGEFYLASPAVLDSAWKCAIAAAEKHKEAGAQ